jgi:hypothetical protein
MIYMKINFRRQRTIVLLTFMNNLNKQVSKNNNQWQQFKAFLFKIIFLCILYSFTAKYQSTPPLTLPPPPPWRIPEVIYRKWYTGSDIPEVMDFVCLACDRKEMVLKATPSPPPLLPRFATLVYEFKYFCLAFCEIHTTDK